MWITWWSIMTCNCKKSEGLERLFLQLIKEKFTNLDKFSPLNYHKILTPSPLSVPPTTISKKIPPINMSRSWFYLFGVRKLFITTTPVWVIRTKKSASLSSQTCLTRSANTVYHDSESISFLKPKIWNLYQTNSKLLKVCKLSKIKLNIRNLKLLL